ncbi:MAG TPA: ATP-binding cassette domain-containing protein [Candidatus Dormibacteraeota bacterium]|jgi:ABC-2 type transport system ATP-binding protein|nr:ATP-binding cassette domain-containing protein [Candidatus Dormibacteraeota bacterium]
MSTTSTAPTVIDIRGLRKTFKVRKGDVEAVAGVDLQVRAGEIFGFLGPNGAGKTTTLRMLATLLPPTAGAAVVAGCDLLTDPRGVRERIGYVGQAGGTDPVVSGRRELVIQGRLYGMGKTEAVARARELIEVMELEEPADRPTGSYSGGQRRRLDVALGLIHRPQVLFLDEPTTGLDPQSRARMWIEIRKLRDQGTTVFLTTHYLEEADALCDRLAIIDHGKIVAEGTPEELKRQVAGDVVTINVADGGERALDLLRRQAWVREGSIEEDGIRLYVESGESALPDILRLLEGAGLSLTTMSLARPSLDDVFLRQTGRALREAAA